MTNFAVRLVHGPGRDPSRQIREQDGWDEHAAFMDGLVDDGFVILGGPVGDGEQTLHAVEAADENEIEARLAEDPGHGDLVRLEELIRQAPGAHPIKSTNELRSDAFEADEELDEFLAYVTESRHADLA